MTSRAHHAHHAARYITRWGFFRGSPACTDALSKPTNMENPMTDQPPPFREAVPTSVDWPSLLSTAARRGQKVYRVSRRTAQLEHITEPPMDPTEKESHP